MADDEVPGDYINNRQDLHDCGFLVGREKKKRISTIRLFLANYSPYFRAMLLETDMLERDSTMDIEIPNHEPDVFILMLNYVYGSQNFTFKNIDQAMRFHRLVDMCLMSRLKRLSSDYLMKHCKTDICKVLECYVLLRIEEMESLALETVRYDTESIIASEDFVNLEFDIILFIVKQKMLSILEVDLWNGVLKWVWHQSGPSAPSGKSIRNTLGEVLKHIRFCNMSSKEFAEQVVPTSVLTPEEVIAVFVSMATGTIYSLPSLCNKIKGRSCFKITLDIGLLPLDEYTQRHESSCSIQVKNKKLQLISIHLTKNSAQFIQVKLLQNDKMISDLNLQSTVNKYELNPPFEPQPNQLYEVVVLYNHQLMSQFQRGPFFTDQRSRSGLLSNQSNIYSETARVVNDSKFCTIRRASKDIDRGANLFGQFSHVLKSCLKNLQFVVVS